MKKKIKMATEEKSDSTFEKSVAEFAGAVVDSLEKGYKSDLEPFELYAQKVRARLQEDVKEFRQRFAKGYHALLDEISKSK